MKMLWFIDISAVFLQADSLTKIGMDRSRKKKEEDFCFESNYGQAKDNWADLHCSSVKLSMAIGDS